MTSVGAHADRGNRAREALLFLAAAAGSLDALAFIVLGHVFASVLTGDLVLFGTSAVHTAGDEFGAPLTAVIFYLSAVALVARLCRNTSDDVQPHPLWPVRVKGCLLGEGVLLIAIAVAAAGFHGAPTGGVQTAILAASTFAMGIQSASILATGRPTASTTYFTSTLIKFTAALSVGSREADWWTAARLGCAVGGAAAGAAVHNASPAWAFAVPAFFGVIGISITLFLTDPAD
jgi:uncharacterized membrane protein YoaK (UPF0700 family)